MTLILLTGNAEAGKSTLANYLIENYDNYVEYALGDKLKSLTFELLKLFGVSITSIEDLYNVELKKKYRKYLQQIGTECCRKVFGDDFWCEMLNKDINESINEGKNIIISDVRFLNEQNYFEKHYQNEVNMYSIMIKRLDNNDLTMEQKNHISESQINKIKCDYVIENDMTNKFFNDIDNVIKKISKNKDKNKLTSIKNKLSDSNISVCDLDNPPSYNKFNSQINDNAESKSHSKMNETPKTNSSYNESIIYNEFVDSTSKEQKLTPTRYSSYELGRIGEYDVLKIIEKLRPAFDTKLVSSTGHLADIHSIDYNNNIKYIFEIKHKLTITKDDVNKFERDIENIQNLEHSPNKVIGIFISLNSDIIPSIGNLSMSRDKIYLTKKYFSENTLDLIFRLIETYFSALNNINETKNVKYEIPSNVIELLVKLRSEYALLTREMEIYTNMKHNTEQNLNSIQELIGKLILKEQFIKFINNEFSDILPELNDSLISNEENKMIEYIQSHAKKSIKKKELLSLFPTMRTKIASMKLDDLIAEYKK